MAEITLKGPLATCRLQQFRFGHLPPPTCEFIAKEDGMEWVPIHKRVIGLDIIHQARITACAILEAADGETRIEQRQFGAFKQDRRALVAWVAALDPDEVVMESSDIYWKSRYAALEAVGIRATVVNAHHVKQIPGCKTDVGDAQWLATLARAGLLRGSFVPQAKLRANSV